jgi:hypothetical protein
MKKITQCYTALLFVLISLLSSSLYAENIGSGELSAAFSSWGKKSVAGSWVIVKEEQQYFIVLGEDFVAKEGPDVKVFLSPKPASEVTGSNATEGSTLITEITRFKGQYRIAIPKDITPGDFQSLVFHCEAYSKLWGTSPLR